MLYRPLLLASAVALLAAATGCTGLTKPDSITISAEPADALPAKVGQAPAQQRQPIPLPAMPAPAPPPADGCGE